MNYKYPPIYKYIILLILITTFLRYYQIINKDSFLLIAGIFTYMVFIFDYILIRNHPSLLMDPSIVNDNINDNENSQNQQTNQNLNKKIIYIKKEKPKKEKKNKIKLIDATKEKKINKKLLDNLDDDCDLDNNSFEKELEELNKKAELSTDTDNLTEEIEKELLSLGL